MLRHTVIGVGRNVIRKMVTIERDNILSSHRARIRDPSLSRRNPDSTPSRANG
jgi:hypothetical protein